MAHIAIDARIMNTSTGRYVERLVHYLEEVDHVNQYTILMPEKDKDFYTPSVDNFSVLIADFDQYSFEEQIGFKTFLDKLGADLVHFCMPQQPILYKGAHITTVHDLTLLKVYNSDKNWLVFHFKQLVGKFVFKHVIKTSIQVMVPTQFVGDDVLQFSKVDPSKVVLTYEAAEVSHDKPEPYDHPFKRFIMYVGQQSDYKNLKRLGTAHQRLIKKYPDLGLILVGSKNASARINEKYFNDKGYKNILFSGYLPDAQLNWLFANAEAYVFPSIMEGFGLPGLEAMGHNTPVASSNGTCLPEVYGDAAHYFDPLDVTDMARAIDDVLSSEDLRKKLVANGKKQYKKYSWKKMAEESHAVYLNALKQISKD